MDRRVQFLLLAAIAIFIGAAGFRLVSGVPAEEAPAMLAPTSADALSMYEARAMDNPESADAQAILGHAYLEHVRVSGDPTYYNLAERSFERTLALDPNYVDALVGMGQLAAARHEFRTAIEWAERARERNPYRAPALGVLVDSYVELGEYELAVETADAMGQLRPDLSSYARISYLRELYGDVEGAIEAMEAAAQTSVRGTEASSWTHTQVGNLYFNKGDWESAELKYAEVIAVDPTYAYALAGKAKVMGARGDLDAAIAIYRPLVERMPIVEFAWTLGDLYTANGENDLAQQQYDLVEVIQQLNAGAGMNVEMELAAFAAEYSDPSEAVALAEAAYTARPSIYGADAYAWALYHAGEIEKAAEISQQALRLGTQDATLYYHAGIIALASGNEEIGHTFLQTALDTNPAFSFKHAAIARAQLTKAEAD